VASSLVYPNAQYDQPRWEQKRVKQHGHERRDAVEDIAEHRAQKQQPAVYIACACADARSRMRNQTECPERSQVKVQPFVGFRYR
jgi:hypothetical protein